MQKYKKYTYLKRLISQKVKNYQLQESTYNCNHFPPYVFSSGLFSFLKSIFFFLSKSFLYYFLVNCLAYSLFSNGVSKVRPFKLMMSVFYCVDYFWIVNIFSIISRLSINSIGTMSVSSIFWSGFIKWYNIYVTFYATNGIDHENKSKKFGKMYGCWFYKNCWMSNVLF